MAYIIDASKVSQLAVELLARTLVLPATVSRVPRQDYSGTGGVVTVRVPTRRTALEQATPGTQITFTAIDEVPVTVDVSHWYDAVRVTDEDLTLSIESFGRQVLSPMLAAVAEAGENRLAGIMNGLGGIAVTSVATTDIFTATAHGFVAGDKVRFANLAGGTGLVNGKAYFVIAAGLTANDFAVSETKGGSSFNHTTNVTAGTVAKFTLLSFPLTPDAAADEAVVIAIRKALTRNDVPQGGRFLAVSPSIASRLLAIDKFSKVNESGSPSALRDAVLGSLFGLEVIESNALTDGQAVAYHRSGLAFATLSPAIPQGAASAAASTSQGISLRTVFDYDANILSDVVAISTFGGAALVDPDRVVKLNTAAA